MISVMFQLLQLIAFIIVNRLFVKTSAYCYYRSTRYNSCADSVEVKYPFIWSGASGSDLNESCGYPGLVIDCTEDGRSVINISNHRYYVQSINYNFKSLRVVDGDVDRQQCPHPRRNFSFQSTPSLSYYYGQPAMIIFYNCSSYPKDVQDIPCLNDDYKNNNSTTTRSFVFYLQRFLEFSKRFNWYGNCEESLVVHTGSYDGNFTHSLQFGVDLVWSTPYDCEDCEDSGGWCSLGTIAGGRACFCEYGTRTFRGVCPKGIPIGVKVIIGVVAGVGGLLLVLIIIYRRVLYSLYTLIISRWRNKSKSPTDMETFLESCGSLALKRYKYSDIKKMTNSFQETLGQGGFGSVFKGKLCDGHLVAVKLLNESKGNGEDFINEVATIGRTNHVNVVTLLGFCIDGAKRALIYEFMSNGSLEKIIYNTTSPSLGWGKLYQIALGIARGLEYLHRGCNTRILHFDIKPHNILLDQDFCPKISDFGLAKLCPTKESVVSMTGARGTVGYIAPEVYCRNFGGVSHKSDVYSYGMMVLEMIGGRKNVDATVENTSEIYFPHWVYNHLKGNIKIERVEDIKIEGSEETFEDIMAKKMIIVALWCIQTHPSNRPSVSNVVDMLERNIEDLQMPPSPFEDPPSTFSFLPS